MPTPTSPTAQREARLARQLAARAAWAADPAHQARAAARAAEQAAEADPTTPKCTAPACTKVAHRANRCRAHYAPLRTLVATMAGADDALAVSRRAFSAAMHTTAMPLARWQDLAEYADAGATAEVQALLDEATDALYAAGWYVGVGPRGGRYLARKGAR